ncbi:MAG: TIM barrel protein [Victivallaceae bacterium]|nr:TIM barrel protein [Victivallaceae bacterium]
MNSEQSCISRRSMPFWCVGNPLSDPFGGPVLKPLDSLEAAEIIAWAGREGYIEATSYHDDDLIPWNPDQPEDDLNPNSAAYKKLREIKKVLDRGGISIHASICNMSGNPRFRNGGFCNPDPEVRRLARLKVERTLRIGQFFGAEYYVYWVARDGFEVPVVTQWDKIYAWLAEGLNGVTDYIESQGMTNYIGATIEPKPNEPRGHMFLPTSGHAVGFILGKLKHRDFWGVNPELLQHESMALMNAVLTVSYLCSMGKLKFLHFGSQIKAQFDNDFPPLAGPEGLKETVMMFWALKRLGWRGVCEFDCHMLRAEADITDQLNTRRQFIINCSTALDIALKLADRVKIPASGTNQVAADLASICQLGKLDGVDPRRKQSYTLYG